jgi:hypothetical protein
MQQVTSGEASTIGDFVDASNMEGLAFVSMAGNALVAGNV